MVPMLTCGLVRWNFAFATCFSSLHRFPTVAAGPGAHARCFVLSRLLWNSVSWLLAACLGDDLLGDAGRDLGIRVELHAVVRPALRPAAQVTHVTEHFRQRDEGLDDPHPGPLLHGLDLTPAAVQV